MKLFSICAASLLLSAAAVAQDMPDRGPMPFSAFDLDGDGAVTEAEFDQMRAKRMAAAAEAGRPMHGMAKAPGFSDFDADGDGKLTPEEFAEARQKHMAMMQAGSGKMMGPGMGPGMGSGMGPGMGPGMGCAMSFESIDTDGNGCIDADEFAAHRQTCMPKAPAPN